MVKEAIREEMVQELDRLRLKELGGTPPPPPAAAFQTRSGSKSGSKPGTPPPVPTDAVVKPGMKVGDNVKVPGTTMNLNQFLQAATKEQDINKKKQMIAQASEILTTLNTLEEKRSASHLADFRFKKSGAEDKQADKADPKKKEVDDKKKSAPEAAKKPVPAKK